MDDGESEAGGDEDGAQDLNIQCVVFGARDRVRCMSL